MFPEQPERTACTSSLCAFASLADEAKGGDGAESALREIFGSAYSFAACRAVGLAKAD